MDPSRPIPWLALVLTACGGSIGSGIDASADQSSSSDAGADKDVTGPGGPCPPSPPNQGEACNLADGFQCEYGGSFWAFCDLMATCSSKQWQVQATQSCPYNEGSSSCPAQLPTNGAACSPQNISCNYQGGQCNCEGQCGGVFIPDAGVDWKCTAPDPNCPWPRPRFGSACTNTSTASCAYDVCCSGSYMQCQNGYWQGSTIMGGCP